MAMMWKRPLALLLALVMLVGCLPMAALAEDTSSQQEGSVQKQPSQEEQPTEDPVAAVQAMIDALPIRAETQEDADALGDALYAVDQAMEDLTQEQCGALNMDRYNQASTAFDEWSEQAQAAEQAWSFPAAPEYKYVSGSVQAKELILPEDGVKASDLTTGLTGTDKVNLYWTVAENPSSEDDWGALNQLTNTDKPVNAEKIKEGAIVIVAQKGLTDKTYTAKAIWKIVVPEVKLTVTDTTQSAPATVSYNFYTEATTASQMNDGTYYADVAQKRYLEASILSNLTVTYGETLLTADDVTIEYYPAYYNLAESKYDYSSSAKSLTEGTTGCKIFAERGENAVEKIKISYNGQYVEAYIQLVDGRKTWTGGLTATAEDATESGVKAAAEAVLKDSGIATDDITLPENWESSLKTGQAVDVTATADFHGDGTYQAATVQVTVSVTREVTPATIAVTNEVDKGAAVMTAADGITVSDSAFEGTLTITVTPKEGGYKVASVTVTEEGGEAETVSLTYDDTVATGSFNVKNDKNYTVAVNYDQRTVGAKDGTVALNLYVGGTLVNWDYSARVEGLEDKLLKATLGETANTTGYTAYVEVEVLGYKQWKAADEMQLCASQVEGDLKVKITRAASNGFTEVSQEVTVTVVDSREKATITVADVGPVTVTDKLDPVLEAVKDATINAGDYTFKLEGEMPTAEAPQSSITVTITAADSKETQGTTETVTVVAKLASYTITWVGGDKQETTTVYHGQTPSVPDGLTTKTSTVEQDFTFTGWDKEITAATADATYTAQFSESSRQYTITWDAGKGTFRDGITSMTTQVAYGETPVAPESPTREDWTFLGWGDIASVTGEATYTAQWTQKRVVTFVTGVEGVTVASQEIEKGKTAAKPADPQWDDDHDFLGWFNGETEFDFTTSIEENLTLTAKWRTDFNHNDIADEEEAHYTIRYVPGQNLGNVEYKDVLAGLTTPAYGEKDPAVEGKLFLGWAPAVTGTVEQQEDGVTEIVYTAQWAEDANKNGVDDTQETLNVQIVGASQGDQVTIGTTTLTPDDTGAVTYIYDSTSSGDLTLTATPVTQSTDLLGLKKLSTTRVAGIAGAGDVTYESFAASVSFAPKTITGTITVTFEEAGFQFREERILNYYPGMTGVTNRDVYDTAVQSPQWSDQAAITVEYLARSAGIQATINVGDLTFSDNATVDGMIKSALSAIGYTTITIDQSETWASLDQELTADVTTGTKTYTQLFNENLTSEKLGQIVEAFNTAYTNASLGSKLSAGAKAVQAELEKIVAEVQQTAQFYGAHEFGQNDTPDQDVLETIRLTYADGTMAILDTTQITLRDMRTPTQLAGENAALVYRDFKDGDLPNLLSLQVQTTEGVAIGDQTFVLVEGSVETKSVSDQPYTVTYRFPGNETYKPSQGTFQVTITKAPATMSIANVAVTYGESYEMHHNVVPGNAYGEAAEIEESLIRFVVGLNVANASLGESGITGVKPTIQLLLPENLTTGLLEGVFTDGMELSLSQLVKYLELINSDSLGVLQQALQAIINVGSAADITVKLGGQLPKDIGTYLYGAVSTSGNYETVMDVAYILITPKAEKVYLDWNYTDTNGVFTSELLNLVDLGASAYNEENFQTQNDPATGKVCNLFFGVNKGENNLPKLTLKCFDSSVEPSTISGTLGNGAYTQMAFVADFGNEMYYAVPIVRAFVMVPSAVKVAITDPEGTNFRRTYDGQPQTVEVEVTYNGTAITIDKANLTVTYTGISTDGKTCNSTTAPTKAGAYLVTAIYRHHDDSDNLIALGLKTQTLLVLPAATETTVDSVVVTKGETVKLEDILHVTTDHGLAAPETTIITAQIATNGGFSQVGWEAIEGNVNIDFPTWVDAILKKYAPEIYDGITATQLSQLVTGELTELLGKLELGDELTRAMEELLGQLNTFLSKLPENASITFEDGKNTTFQQVGVTLVGAIVTDSNYRVSGDFGFVVVQPKVEKVWLDWNYHDENGFWTEELLKHADLGASAYDDEAFTSKNPEATDKITYTFLGIDSSGNITVSHDTASLPHGAYLEFAYLELKLDGEMTVSNFIARPMVTLANPVKVEFVDENGTWNPDRKSTYDGQSHGMDVRVTVGDAIITPAAGELTVTYRGVTTAGKTYNSTTPPRDAGVYTATAVFARYDGETLLYGGAAVGAMAILPAEADFSVTGGKVYYDGQPHGVTVKPGDVDYTLISGYATVAGDSSQVGLEAVTANLNVDFPQWVDDILAEKLPNAYANGIGAKALIAKLEAAREELAALGVKETWVDTLIEALEKVPDTITVTFRSNVTYTQPGVYVFAGLLTDFNYRPAFDTGLLEILKEEAGLKDTEVYYDGQGHEVRTVDVALADYVTLILDGKRGVANLLTSEKEAALTALLADLPNSATREDVLAKMDARLDAVEVEAGAFRALRDLREKIASLPAGATVNVNAYWRPTNVGTYSFCAVGADTEPLSATLTIKPAQVHIIRDDATKYFGLIDPTNEVRIEMTAGALSQPELTGLEKAMIPGREKGGTEEGKLPGTYPYTITWAEGFAFGENYEVTLSLGKLTIVPAEITITVASKEKNRGTADPANPATVQVKKGFVQSKDMAQVKAYLGVSVSRDPGEDPGTYAYRVTYKEHESYRVTCELGSLTILDTALPGYPVRFEPDDTHGIAPGSTVEINGNSYRLDEDCTVRVSDTSVKVAQTFVYKTGEGKDAYQGYPIHSYAWYLTFDEDGNLYNTERIEELDDFFEYNGTSIRVNFTSNGIRFITSVNTQAASALMKGTLIQGKAAGFKMISAGTLFAWGTLDDDLLNLPSTAKSLVYGIDGESEMRVFQRYNGRDWFTGMLTNLDTDAVTLDRDLISRPFAELQRGDEVITIYGGTIQRSIYYVAQQNKDWKVGTVYNDFIKGIITTVEESK